MNWNNLKKNKCPQCGKNIGNVNADFFRCQCGFTVSVGKFRQIASSNQGEKFRPHWRPKDEEPEN